MLVPPLKDYMEGQGLRHQQTKDRQTEEQQISAGCRRHHAGETVVLRYRKPSVRCLDLPSALGLTFGIHTSHQHETPPRELN